MGWHPVQPRQGLCVGTGQGLETCRTEPEGTVPSGLMLAEPELCQAWCQSAQERRFVLKGMAVSQKQIGRRKRSLGDTLQQVPAQLVPAAIWRWQEFPPEKASRGWGMVSWGMGVSRELVVSLTG